MNGGCETCKHSCGEENCKGCLWDGKSQMNTHWEQRVLEEELDFISPKRIVRKLISVDVLDKIRAEIEKAIWEDTIYNFDGSDEVIIPRLDPDDVFEIINKYKAEVEE